MNRFIALVLFTVVAITLVQSGDTSARPGFVQGAKKWEYAVLVHTAKPTAKETTVALRLPTKLIQGKSLQEVCQQFGQPIQEESAALALNILGDWRWELVSYVERESIIDGARTVTATWVFKRPR